MPRLLLVDDNPSIHRIAESLLAPTDVELVCVDSAAAALDRFGRGDHFDVALIDTAMPGMDGWTLLDRLRGTPETAHLPIALMAGVLDPVDPAKLAKAPVQGFLKKPIELRELGDRVKALLAVPVTPAPAAEASPFSTVPATSTRDLARMIAPDLPEFRPEPAPASAEPVLASSLETEEDLLVLSAEDLWPEEVPAAAVPPEDPSTPEIHLELEELDLDSLQGLAAEPLPAAAFAAEPPPAPADEPAEAMALTDLGDFDALPADLELSPLPVSVPDPFHAEPPAFEPPFEEAGEAVPAAGIAALADLITAAPERPAREAAFAVSHAPDTAPVPALEQEEALAAAGQGTAAAGQTGDSPADPAQAKALVQALLADPGLMDALVKAVVARMGDQVVREIAWEIMPDLAGKLQK